LELEILNGYLPEQLSEAALQKIIDEAIKETNAVSMKDMGAVMKSTLAKAAGNADNKMVSELVKKTLSNL